MAWTLSLGQHVTYTRPPIRTAHNWVGLQVYSSTLFSDPWPYCILPTNQSARSGCKDQSVCPFWVQGPISLPVLGARTNQSARSGCKDQSVCPFWVQGYQTPGQLSYTSTASRTESCHAEPEYALLVISQRQGNGCYGYQPKLCTSLFVSYTALRGGSRDLKRGGHTYKMGIGAARIGRSCLCAR